MTDPTPTLDLDALERKRQEYLAAVDAANRGEQSIGVAMSLYRQLSEEIFNALPALLASARSYAEVLKVPIVERLSAKLTAARQRAEELERELKFTRQMNARLTQYTAEELPLLARVKAAEHHAQGLRAALERLPRRFEVERLFGGACCERLLTPNGVGGVVFCDLIQGHLGSHEGADDNSRRWWFNESGAGLLRTTHPTTSEPLPANRQIFDAVYARMLSAVDAIDAALAQQPTADQPAPTWQAISTAPKGGFPLGSASKYTTDPDWVEPPVVLLWLEGHGPCAARWDHYYADGGNGYNGQSAWVEPTSGEQGDSSGRPTHWMPLPAPPADQPAPEGGECQG